MNIITYKVNGKNKYNFIGLTKVLNKYIFDNVIVEDIENESKLYLTKNEFQEFVKCL